MDIPELRLRFEQNPFLRADLNLAEGIGHMMESGFSSRGALSITPDKLVESAPQAESSLVGDNFDSLTGVEDSYLRFLSGAGPKPSAKMVYQMIRGGGRVHQNLFGGVDVVEFQPGSEVNRMSNYYTAITQLGEFFFNEVPSDLYKREIRLSISYNMITGFEQTCASAASSSYECQVNIQVRTSELETGEPVIWMDDYTNPSRLFNQKYRDVAMGVTTKAEDVCSALGLSRQQEREEDINTVRDYFNTSLNSSLINRFVVMELLRLRTDMTRRKVLPIRNMRTIQRYSNAINGIAECIRALRGSMSTVVNAAGMSSTEVRILIRSALGYRNGDFMIDGDDLYLGGFFVQSEVEESASIGCISDDSIATDDLEVTSFQIYTTMLKYAIKMNAYEEMQEGRVLALSLLMSDGIPNFSLPRPQGYLDIVASAIQRNGDNALVPPFAINPYTTLGALVVIRQCLLCVSDFMAHACIPNSVDKNASSYLSDGERHHLYNWFKEKRFSDAFSVTRILDPLRLVSPRSKRRANSIVFPTVGWSAINNRVVLKNSCSQYFLNGEWADKRSLEQLDPDEQRLVLSTYLVNGLIENAVTTGVVVRDGRPVDREIRFSNLHPGKIGTSYLDMSYTSKIAKGSGGEFLPTPYVRRSVGTNPVTGILEFKMDDPPEEESDEDMIVDDEPEASSSIGVQTGPSLEKVAPTVQSVTQLPLSQVSKPDVRTKTRGPKKRKNVESSTKNNWRQNNTQQPTRLCLTKSVSQESLGIMRSFLEKSASDTVNTLSTRWHSLVSWITRGSGKRVDCALARYFGVSQVCEERVNDWRGLARVVRMLVNSAPQLIPAGPGKCSIDILLGHAMVAEACGLSRTIYRFNNLPLGDNPIIRELIRRLVRQADICVLVQGRNILDDDWEVGEDFDQQAYKELCCVITGGFRHADTSKLMVHLDNGELPQFLLKDEFTVMLKQGIELCLKEGSDDGSDD